MHQSSLEASTNLRIQKGLSLIKVMITIIILGALVGLVVAGYPSYTHYTVKGNRFLAANYVTNLANRQAKNNLDNVPYQDQLSLTSSETIPTKVSKNYVVTATADNSFTPAAYSIRATPIGTQLKNDTECGTLEINQAGIKTISGTGTLDKCWRTRS